MDFGDTLPQKIKKRHKEKITTVSLGHFQWDFQGPPSTGPLNGKFPILFPFRNSYGSGMGIVWETYHKGIPLLGVPGITLDIFPAGGAARSPFLCSKAMILAPRFVKAFLIWLKARVGTWRFVAGL